jgi:hypothetical protein
LALGDENEDREDHFVLFCFEPAGFQLNQLRSVSQIIHCPEVQSEEILFQEAALCPCHEIRFFSVPLASSRPVNAATSSSLSYYLPEDQYLYILRVLDANYQSIELFQIKIPRKNEAYHQYPFDDAVTARREMEEMKLEERQPTIESQIIQFPTAKRSELGPFVKNRSDEILAAIANFHAPNEVDGDKSLPRLVPRIL